MSTDDLIDYFKIEATVSPQETLQTTYKVNRARRIRERTQTRWVRVKRVGEGAFGQVWEETHTNEEEGTEDRRAVKILDKARMRAFKVDIKKELTALSKLAKEEYRQAEVFVSFHGWYQTDTAVFLAMEYFPLGDLSTNLKDVASENDIREITTDLLEGLRIMHAEGFTHRDLKPQNIFVFEKPATDGKWGVKIGDFGIAKRVISDETALRTRTGTPHFLAPEIQGFVDEEPHNSAYTNAVDLWSLGCIVYVLAAQRVPFPRPSELNSFCHGKSEFPEEPLHRLLSREGIEFVKCLMKPKPAERLTAAQALELAWVLSSSPTPGGPVRTESAPPPTAASQFGSTQTIARKPVPTRAQTEYPTWAIGSPQGTGQVSHQWQPGTTNYDNPESTAKWSTAGEETFEDKFANFKLNDKSKIPHQASPTSQASSGQVPQTDLERIPTLEAQLKKADEEKKDSEQQRLENERMSAAPTAVSEIPESFEPDPGVQPVVLDPGVTMWDMMRETSNPVLADHKDYISFIVFARDGKKLAVGCSGKQALVFDTRRRTRMFLLQETSETEDMAFSPDSKLVASALKDHTIRIRDAETGMDRFPKLEGHGDWVICVTFSHDGGMLASGDSNNIVKVWKLHTTTAITIWSFSGHTSWIRDVAFSPDNRWIASTSDDKTARLWSVELGDAGPVLTAHTSKVESVVFSPDGRSLATGSKDKTVIIWDLAFPDGPQSQYVAHHKTWTNPHTVLRGHTRRIPALDWSADGRFVASCAHDNSVRIWDAHKKEIHAVLKGHTDDVKAVAFSPDSRWLASAGSDQNVWVWEVQRRREPEAKAKEKAAAAAASAASAIPNAPPIVQSLYDRIAGHGWNNYASSR